MARWYAILSQPQYIKVSFFSGMAMLVAMLHCCFFSFILLDFERFTSMSFLTHFSLLFVWPLARQHKLWLSSCWMSKWPLAQHCLDWDVTYVLITVFILFATNASCRREVLRCNMARFDWKLTQPSRKTGRLTATASVFSHSLLGLCRSWSRYQIVADPTYWYGRHCLLFQVFCFFRNYLFLFPQCSWWRPHVANTSFW